MRTLELINLILLALNLCFYLAANWIITAVRDYFRSVNEAYEYMKQQHEDIMESYNKMFRQYEKMDDQFRRLRESEDERS